MERLLNNRPEYERGREARRDGGFGADKGAARRVRRARIHSGKTRRPREFTDLACYPAPRMRRGGLAEHAEGPWSGPSSAAVAPW